MFALDRNLDLGLNNTDIWEIQIYDNVIFWKSHDNLMIVEITKYISGNVKNIDNDRYVILCN